MPDEIPTYISDLIDSYDGKLVTDPNQVSDSEIVVAASFTTGSNVETLAVLVVTFPDEARRNQFKDGIYRGCADPKLLSPWGFAEYLSQPAGDYFRNSGGNEGSSGASQLDVSISKNNRDDG